MSAEVAVRVAVIAALKGDSALMAGMNGIYDGDTGRAAMPYGIVGECIGADWGGKDVAGRELRLTIGLTDPSAGPERLGPRIARVETLLGGVPPRDGWRIVTARLARSRVARADRQQPGGGWQAILDYRLRAVRDG